MGNVCCIPRSLDLPTEAFSPKLPSGIVHLTTKSDPARVAEACEVIALSFAGSTTAAPEGALSWVLDPDASGDNPCAPLLAAPSESRIAFFRYIAKWSMESGLRHGGCFALEDSSGKLVAAAVTFPPNSNHLHDPGFCELILIAHRIGFKNAPAEFRPPTPRLEAAGKVLKESHKEHAPGKHIYINAFATAAGNHGKGYGRRLLSFINETADHLGVESYLETSGSRNELFYGRNEFEVKGHYAIEHDGIRFDPKGTGGLTAMVRKPRMRG